MGRTHHGHGRSKETGFTYLRKEGFGDDSTFDGQEVTTSREVLDILEPVGNEERFGVKEVDVSVSEEMGL